jgi:hypothetical protein
VSQFKSTLGSRFKTKDLGELHHIMGMHITRDRLTAPPALSINQSINQSINPGTSLMFLTSMA